MTSVLSRKGDLKEEEVLLYSNNTFMFRGNFVKFYKSSKC